LARLVGAGIVGQVAGGRCPSRGEKKREREGPGFKLKFLKISNRNLKNSKHESCREFENLQLLF
jgi:hypothetical protein